MKRRWAIFRVPFLCAVVLLCAAGIVVRQPQAVPPGVYATPTPMPTPTPFLPTPTPVPTPVPGAITILYEGAIVCTVESEEHAEELLSFQLQRAEAGTPADEKLQLAAFKAPVTQRAALVGELPISISEAKALLEKNEKLLSTYSITRKVQNEIIPFKTETKEDKRIPYGSRIVLQVGRPGLHTITTTRTYSNGLPDGEPVIEESTLDPTPESILVGLYIADTPDGTPGRSEGVLGKARPEGLSLKLPFDGAIISNFGTRARVMHYGIDIQCKVGDAIQSPGDGIVSFVGVRGSYGLVVEISHIGGFVSRLAPLKDIVVDVGSEVFQEQPIGSLAPPVDEEASQHLHMELLIDGIPYNPRQYLD